MVLQYYICKCSIICSVISQSGINFVSRFYHNKHCSNKNPTCKSIHTSVFISIGAISGPNEGGDSGH